MGEKISGEKLLTLFVSEMNKSIDFLFVTGTQPFKIRFSDKDYFVYIKNLSSAYFKNRPNVTRAQLPIREEFNFIKESDIPFIFLGYDIVNDVYVCWDYNIVKQRLNTQENVSLYSRKTLQEQVQENEFLQSNLKNGDKIVLFKRNNVVSFFENIETFFMQTVGNIAINSPAKDFTVSTGKLYKLSNSDLLERLKPLLTGTTLHTLEAIQIVQDFYKDSYPNMTYKDWSTLVKSISF